MQSALSVAIATTAGSARQRNEDAVGIDGWHLAPDSGGIFTLDLDPEVGHVFAVADGMGGHRGGATASAITARRVSASAPGADDLARRAIDAHETLRRMDQTDPDIAGLGSTVAALGWSSSRELGVMTVGDSLVYRLVDGVLGRITRPQRAGAGLLQCIGGGQAEPPVPETRTLVASAGSRYLLCSDGAWEPLLFDEIEALLAGGDTVAAARQTLRAVHAKGAPDNATVLIVDIPEATS